MFGWFEKRLDPFPSSAPSVPPKKLLPFVWHYVQPAWPWLLLLGLMSMGIAVAEAMLYKFLGSIVDWLSTANRETFFADEGWHLMVMAGLVLFLLPLMGAIHTMTMHQTLAGNFGMIARWKMHRFLLRHSMNFFANEFAGRVSTKVMQTALAIREVALKVIDVFVYAISFVVSMLFMVAAADWRLVIPLLVWLGIYMGILTYFVPKLGRLAQEQADARSMMTGRIVDSYTNISTIKLFSHAGREERYAREGMNVFLGTVHRQMRKISGFNILIDLNNAVVLFSTASLGLYFWMQGSVTAGSVAIAISLAMRVNGMSQWIMWEVTSLFENIGTVYDGMSMMTKPHDIVDAPKAPQLAAPQGAIRYDNVRFHYGKNKGVIDGLTLDIKSGEKVGLVGRSGAGKTTLMNLLLRFYDLEAGKITIDGQDISKVSQDSLRELIGVVTQDTSLLHRSIRDNIAYGHPEATDEQVIAAAKRANAWDFVETLVDMHGRQGLDAQVGERGVKLSGGQRQRIAIARVFLKNAPILVLDEATSALDSEVEAAIQENLFSLMEGKTVIAIAHRLSTLTEMDRLIILDKGQIVESGSHAELAAMGGIYADLWRRQSGGFIADHEAEVAAE
ncbi:MULTISPECIES: ABC transporter ATP-binding protein [Rhizobium/Agrobacterium group]|jgi:ATP-binding cassette subfamily B multidrug efflux pump|uniref:ABC transporter ATP-binding protein n=2 Tax=Rhizobium/Agrobacterium group TaxID=227290 RepID=A0A1B9UUS6_AGRTU|nr:MULTISPECIES: ABC transporter ATP-binding protein [Rhizobium/Agrobacterium group]AHK02066.1 lipid A export ATP-binding/permease protein MsbA [Agrobacterium tumefaciens LBA4213 (Ach5)]AKC07896.1 multidrug ABC transporter ATP-binding protein [Agrobacterium tumefaciens]EHJ98696.1 multidrug ABC transporter nucleotide-binding protein/ATPase [Agrobacterium tumefaciens 5A]AYM16736.1 multidrug ABC transporter ATP-binding protein [Agrobacterium tumefaciens]AYM68037.1 multidrug ABC transporter ATP-bi